MSNSFERCEYYVTEVAGILKEFDPPLEGEFAAYKVGSPGASSSANNESRESHVQIDCRVWMHLFDSC